MWKLPINSCQGGSGTRRDPTFAIRGGGAVRQGGETEKGVGTSWGHHAGQQQDRVSLREGSSSRRTGVECCLKARGAGGEGRGEGRGAGCSTLSGASEIEQGRGQCPL